jgi:hypothetical protein
VPLFYGWQDNPATRCAFVNAGARPVRGTIGDPDGGGDLEELWLLEEFDVTLEQLRWRRVTISTRSASGKIEVPPGAPRDAGAGVHRVGHAGVRGDPDVEGDQGSDRGAAAGARACCARPT